MNSYIFIDPVDLEPQLAFVNLATRLLLQDACY